MDRNVEREYRVMDCLSCQIRVTYQGEILRGFADHVTAHCPQCGADLGTMRHDTWGEPLALTVKPITKD